MLPQLLATLIEAKRAEGFSPGAAYSYDVEAVGMREQIITPRGVPMFWIPERALKEYPQVSAPLMAGGPPFDPAKRYVRDWSPRQLLLRLSIPDALEQRLNHYVVLTNNRPLLRSSVLIAALALTDATIEAAPQRLTPERVADMFEIARVLSPSLSGDPAGFCVAFNGWDAGASVNQFHCHAFLEGDVPPSGSLPLRDVPVEPFLTLRVGAGAYPSLAALTPAECTLHMGVASSAAHPPRSFVRFRAASVGAVAAMAAKFAAALVERNVPHNAAFLYADGDACAFIFPRSAGASEAERARLSFIGAYEVCGVVTLYALADRTSPLWGDDALLAEYMRAACIPQEAVKQMLRDAFNVAKP